MVSSVPPILVCCDRDFNVMLNSFCWTSMQSVKICSLIILHFLRHESVHSDGNADYGTEIHTTSPYGNIWQPGKSWAQHLPDQMSICFLKPVFVRKHCMNSFAHAFLSLGGNGGTEDGAVQRQPASESVPVPGAVSWSRAGSWVISAGDGPGQCTGKMAWSCFSCS